MLAKSSWVSLEFLIYHIAQAAFTKVLLTAGGNALRKSGKDTGSTNASWIACEVKKCFLRNQKTYYYFSCPSIKDNDENFTFAKCQRIC